MPNPAAANPGVAERAPWQSTKCGVAGVSSLLEMPTDSCHFPCHPRQTPVPTRTEGSFLEDRNLLKLRYLDSSGPFFLSDHSIWEQ